MVVRRRLRMGCDIIASGVTAIFAIPLATDLAIPTPPSCPADRSRRTSAGVGLPGNSCKPNSSCVPVPMMANLSLADDSPSYVELCSPA